ncbi:amino acid ABC transporter permease [Kitasatospora sp. NPDC097691]|uniref:amino acid ABC transporter permease n=1 Tax=Kitasatospora sp. NPDC097691 TaxID=3157231 RepID=UPI00332BE349
MKTLIDNWSTYWEGFLGTLSLFAVSAVLSLVLGVLIAGFRVSPVRPLRVFGAVWVTILRNTPLTLLFFIVVLGLPRFDITLPFYTFAVLALGCYTSAFVCEAMRAGVNTVPPGQGEAARSLGMSFGQTMGLVVLPQAYRSVVAPIGSVMIALAKNTAIAGSFSVTELLGTYRTINELGYGIVWTFFWIAVGYLIITLGVSVVFYLLERRVAVSR